MRWDNLVTTELWLTQAVGGASDMDYLCFCTSGYVQYVLGVSTRALFARLKRWARVSFL